MATQPLTRGEYLYREIVRLIIHSGELGAVMLPIEDWLYLQDCYIPRYGQASIPRQHFLVCGVPVIAHV